MYVKVPMAFRCFQKRKGKKVTKQAFSSSQAYQSVKEWKYKRYAKGDNRGCGMEFLPIAQQPLLLQASLRLHSTEDENPAADCRSLKHSPKGGRTPANARNGRKPLKHIAKVQNLIAELYGHVCRWRRSTWGILTVW